MQVVDYEPAGGGEPALVLAGEDGLETVPLTPGTDLTYALGRRHCAGAVVAGAHEPCDSTASPRCGVHEDPWPCARCVGDCDRPVAACHEEHGVYLAAFAPRTFKVGVTRLWRLERRLREQGADRGALIRTVPDGRTARQIEADVAAEIPDRVRIEEKVAALAATVDEAAWEGLLADFPVDRRVRLPRAIALEHRPLLVQRPWGTVRGVRGRLLVLDRRETAVAVDLRALVGYEVEPGADPPPRQTSIDAFG